MGKIGEALVAGLGGAALGGLDEYANKKLQDKIDAKKNPPDTTKPKVIANAPSYNIARQMRPDQTPTKPADDATE